MNLKKGKHSRAVVIILSLLTLITLNTSRAEIVKNKDPDFSVTIPDNFSAFSKELKPAAWLYGFQERTGFKDEPKLTIGIEKLDYALKSPYKITLKSVRKNFPLGTVLEERSFKFAGITVRGLRVVLDAAGIKSVIYHVPVPTKPKAIQISVGGLQEKEAEMLGVLENVLATVELKPAQPKKKFR